MKIIIIGPPGSGKGTQTKLIKEYLNIEIVSIGNILRKEINEKTEIGKKIENILKNGFLIHDDIIFKLIKNKIINRHDFILDGFPRTLNQAKFLLKENLNINYIFNIYIENKILIKRIKYRLINKNQENQHNIIYKKPKIKNIDDLSGNHLIIRSDDFFDTVINRLKVYNENNLDIMIFLKTNCNFKVLDIDGNQKIENIFNSIKINII